ncbi:MAG TPA: MFS transporter [Acidimicrobiales bacterium]
MDHDPAPHGARSATRERASGHVALAVVVTLAMVFGTVTPFVVGALSPFLLPALSLSRSQLGLFVTVNFTVAALVSIPGGRLIDRIESRAVMTALFVISGAAMLGIAASTSVVMFLLFAIPAGVVQAASNPVTNLLVARYTPRRYRGVVLGAKQAGVHIGGTLVGVILPAVALVAGWRVAVVVAAATALVALAASRRVVPVGGTPGHVAGGDGAPFRWTDGGVPYLTLYAFFMGGGVSAVMLHLPLYAHERLGMDEATAGSVLATFAFTGVVARLLWGWVGDRATRVAQVLLGLAAGATVATLVLWQAESGATWTVWLAAVALGLSAAAWNAVGMLAVVREVRQAHVGRATGLVTMGFFAGFIVSPPAFGALVDATDAYTLGWVVITAHFALAALLTGWWWLRSPGQRAGSPGTAVTGPAQPG